jgi:integral membrane protein
MTHIDDDVARLKRVGTAEGLSFLLLLGVAMPLKYLKGLPLGVTIIGSIHGFLWILYLAVIWQAGRSLQWKTKTYAWGVAASMLPFGPFVFDRWATRQSSLWPES